MTPSTLARVFLFAAFVFAAFAALAALAVATMTRVFEWVDGLAFPAGAGPQLRDEAHLHLELLLDLGKFFGVLVSPLRVGEFDDAVRVARRDGVT